jgi:RNA processing factor Prp31
MDFAVRRERAIADTKRKLREPLHDDNILIHLYRSKTTDSGMQHWLETIVPELENAEETIKKKGKEAWDPQGNGAQMGDAHWKLLVQTLKGEKVDIEEYTQDVAPNLTAVCGWETAARLMSAAGSLEGLSRMTQRDCQNLGNESGQFGGKSKKSVLEEHELASSDRALRILGSRSVLAARIDAHNGEFKGDKLHQEVLYAQ